MFCGRHGMAIAYGFFVWPIWSHPKFVHGGRVPKVAVNINLLMWKIYQNVCTSRKICGKDSISEK